MRTFQVHQPPVVWWSANRIAAMLREDQGEDDRNFVKLDTDIWTTDQPIPMHTDRQEAGWTTIGCVIQNESGFVLVGENVWPLQAGSFFVIDPAVPHGVLGLGHRTGRFSFLAWDMKGVFDPRKTTDEITHRLYSWGGEWAHKRCA